MLFCPLSDSLLWVRIWVKYNQSFVNSFPQKSFNSCVLFSAVSHTVSSSILPYSCATTFLMPRIAHQGISGRAVLSPSENLFVSFPICMIHIQEYANMAAKKYKPQKHFLPKTWFLSVFLDCSSGFMHAILFQTSVIGGLTDGKTTYSRKI